MRPQTINAELYSGDCTNIIWLINHARPESVDHALALAQLRTKIHALANKTDQPAPDVVPDTASD
jgi:hypothetical protein